MNTDISLTSSTTANPELNKETAKVHEYRALRAEAYPLRHTGHNVSFSKYDT